MQQRVLWIDDERFPPHPHFCVARTAGQAKTLLLDQPWDVVYVDHDLASFDESGKETTGYDVLKWFFDTTCGPIPPRFMLLTSNTVGRRNIIELLSQYAPHVIVEYHKYEPPSSVTVDIQIAVSEGTFADTLARTSITIERPQGYSHVRRMLEHAAREMVFDSIHTGPLK